MSAKFTKIDVDKITLTKAESNTVHFDKVDLRSLYLQALQSTTEEQHVDGHALQTPKKENKNIQNEVTGFASDTVLAPRNTITKDTEILSLDSNALSDTSVNMESEITALDTASMVKDKLQNNLDIEHKLSDVYDAAYLSEIEEITQSIEAFNAWKNKVFQVLTSYVSWMQTKFPNHAALDDLHQISQLFTAERLRLVVVGEFSRGKSEFINALLAQQVQIRLFPTRVGRTTMCPVELYSDLNATPYLKLLPIQTRDQHQSLAYFRTTPEIWYHHDLDLRQPEAMKQILREVARTIEVKNEEALALGFNPEFLEASIGREGYVHTPAWRHALINFSHPLLNAGISIVDTPGINAPGVEADLTEDVLPDAQGLLFLLSVETGVTASDYAMWHQKIAPMARRYNIALLGMLNKIDLLENEEESIIDSVERLVRMTSKQLKIATKQIIPMSAKYALKGAIDRDEQTIKRSGFAKINIRVVEQVLQTRKYLLQHVVLKQVQALLEKDLMTMRKQATSSEANDLIRHHKLVALQHELAQQTRLLENIVHKNRILIDQSRVVELEVKQLFHTAKQHVNQLRYQQHREKSLLLLQQVFNKDTQQQAESTNPSLQDVMRAFIQQVQQDLAQLKTFLLNLNQNLIESLEQLGLSSILIPLHDIEDVSLILTEMSLYYCQASPSPLTHITEIRTEFYPKMDAVFTSALGIIDYNSARINTQLESVVTQSQKNISNQKQRVEELNILVGLTNQVDDQTLLNGFIKKVQISLES